MSPALQLLEEKQAQEAHLSPLASSRVKQPNISSFYPKEAPTGWARSSLSVHIHSLPVANVLSQDAHPSCQASTCKPTVHHSWGQSYFFPPSAVPLAFGQLSAGSRGFLPTALLIELLYIEGSSKATWKKKGKSPK